jgi:hypothetical protein
MDHAIKVLQHRIDIFLLLWVNANDKADADHYMQRITMLRRYMRKLKWQRFWSNLWQQLTIGF